MNTLVTRIPAFAGLRAAAARFADEANELLSALTSPGRFVAEVQSIRTLLVAAHRVEATDPDRAALLRRRASRIGLR